MPHVAQLKGGAIPIPEEIRAQLGLRDGDKFEIELDQGTLVLRRATLANAEQVQQFLAWTQGQKKTDTKRRVTIADAVSVDKEDEASKPSSRKPSGKR